MDESKAQLTEITGTDELDRQIREHNSFLAVLFYTEASARSKDALKILTAIRGAKPDTPLATVNASRTRDIHPRFGVSSVPTVITLKKGRLVHKVEGLQTRSTYEELLSNAPRKRADGSEAPPLRVTVYSSPTCPPCNVVKAYLRKKSVPFRVVDLSRDEHAAREIMSRTGSSAVPQTDINGTVVIGADMARIDELLRTA